MERGTNDKKGQQDGDPQRDKGVVSQETYRGQQMYFYQQQLPPEAYGYHMMDESQWAAHTHSMQQQNYQYSEYYG
jgi:hypothetical protein